MLQYIIAFGAILIFMALFIRKPKVETYVLFVAYTLPFVDTKILPLEYGFVKVFDVVSVLSGILLFKEFITYKKHSKNMVYLVLVILFWVFLLLSKINSAYPMNNLHFLYQPFTIFVFARFLLLYLEKKPGNMLRFIGAFQLSVLVLAGVVFLQLLVGPTFGYANDINPNVLDLDTGIIRYPGLFNDSQTCGQFLALGSFSLLFFKTKLLNQKRGLHYTAFLLVSLAVFLAGSRSALGGWLIGLVFLMIFERVKVKALFFSFLAIGFVSVLFLFPENPIVSRSANVSEDYLFRQSIWQETGEIIEEYPLLGIGFGNFQKYIKRNHQNLYLQTEDGGEYYYFNQPENGYLKVLVEQGYIGFIIFLLLLAIPIIAWAKLVLKGRSTQQMIVSIAAFIAWAVAFNTVYSLLDYRILIAFSAYLCLLIHHTQVVEQDPLKITNPEWAG